MVAGLKTIIAVGLAAFFALPVSAQTVTSSTTNRVIDLPPTDNTGRSWRDSLGVSHTVNIPNYMGVSIHDRNGSPSAQMFIRLRQFSRMNGDPVLGGAGYTWNAAANTGTSTRYIQCPYEGHQVAAYANQSFYYSIAQALDNAKADPGGYRVYMGELNTLDQGGADYVASFTYIPNSMGAIAVRCKDDAGNPLAFNLAINSMGGSSAPSGSNIVPDIGSVSMAGNYRRIDAVTSLRTMYARVSVTGYPTQIISFNAPQSRTAFYEVIFHNDGSSHQVVYQGTGQETPGDVGPEESEGGGFPTENGFWAGLFTYLFVPKNESITQFQGLSTTLSTWGPLGVITQFRDSWAAASSANSNAVASQSGTYTINLAGANIPFTMDWRPTNAENGTGSFYGDIRAMARTALGYMSYALFLFALFNWLRPRQQF